MKIKLMILGYARHGKDTVAEILRDNLGLTFMSSSFAAADKVMVPFLAGKGITYASLDECYADRVNHRQDWYEQIKAYNTPDGARLAREIYKTNDIYVGMRNWEELEAVRKERLFDYAIWVDRSKHALPEPSTSCSVTPAMASYVIDNNGTLEQLKVNTLALYWNLISLEYAGKPKEE
jgi:hypothetical protein